MNDQPSAYEVFLDAYLQELIDTPDSVILESVDANSVVAKNLRILEAAKAEAGKKRLMRARAKMKEISPALPTNIPISEARAFVQATANDPRMTLAARNLNELSDDDVLRLYHQIIELKALNDGAKEK